MTKTGVFESDPPAMARATELKKELQRLVRAIVDDEDCSAQTIDEAKEKLCALKELKLSGKRSLSLKLLQTLTCPEEFRCPFSKELMGDPVIVATGQVGIYQSFLCLFSEKITRLQVLDFLFHVFGELGKRKYAII
jgi:hypothetical protein